MQYITFCNITEPHSIFRAAAHRVLPILCISQYTTTPVDWYREDGSNWRALPQARWGSGRGEIPGQAMSQLLTNRTCSLFLLGNGTQAVCKNRLKQVTLPPTHNTHTRAIHVQAGGLAAGRGVFCVLRLECSGHRHFTW